MTLNTRTLADHLNFGPNRILVEVERLNLKYDLGITSTELTRNQYDVLRSLLDPDYLVKILMKTKIDRKYDYTRNTDYSLLLEWITMVDLEGYSTKEVKDVIPDYIRSRGHQIVGATMRAAGYKSSVDVLDNGKQGRRWHKAVSTPSFF